MTMFQHYRKRFQMLYLGDSAKDRIMEIFHSEGKSPDEYFVRISVKSGGCSGMTYDMQFDNVTKPTDQIFEDKGMRLVTDLTSFLFVCNTTLQFSGDLNGKGFYFDNPNATRTCGCGESFAL
jgi:iron-sulfur cluster assembly protein